MSKSVILCLLSLVFVCVTNRLSAQQMRFAQVKKKVDELVHSSGNNAELFRIRQELVVFDSFRSPQEWKQSLAYLVDAASEKPDTSYFKILLSTAKGLQQHDLYKEAFCYLYKARLIRGKIPAITSDHTRLFFEVAGLSAYYFGQWKECEKYTGYALCSGVASFKDSINYLNTLGLCYTKGSRFDRANHYFKRAYAIAEKHQQYDWIGVLSGNIGSNLYKQGKSREALPFLKTDYTYSEKFDQLESAVAALSYLVKVSIGLDDERQAEYYYMKMKTLPIDKSNLFIRRYVLEASAVYFESKGAYRNALNVERELYKINEKIASKRSLEGVEKIEFQLNFQQEQDRSKVLNEKKFRYQMLTYMSLALFVLATITGWILFRSWKRDRLLKEMQLIQKNEALDKELRQAEMEMQNLILSLIEKNQLVNTLSEELDRQDEKQQAENDTLESFVLLTDEDWLRFKLLFERLHPGFFDRLHGCVEHLSNGDIRIAALLRMNLSNVEISRMLGISAESVRKSLFRFRKKIGLDDVHALKDYLRNM
jgi:hypothetical protein